jgi:hypothetical protein
MKKDKAPQPSQLSALADDIQPQKFLLERDICTIGRSPTCQIVVARNIVSRLHAKIEFNGSRHLLYDSNSANGTFVNGRRVYEPHLLRNKDQIGLGEARPSLSFMDPDTTAYLRPRLEYDEQHMTFLLNAQPITLTPAQLRLLSYLYYHAGQVCTRENCAQALWGRDYDPGLDADALDRAVATLRQQLRRLDPSADLIHTRRGVGYILTP